MNIKKLSEIRFSEILTLIRALCVGLGRLTIFSLLSFLKNKTVSLPDPQAWCVCVCVCVRACVRACVCVSARVLAFISTFETSEFREISCEHYIITVHPNAVLFSYSQR